MTYGEVVAEITTGLESLDYKAYKGKEYTLDKGGSSGKPEDKAFLIRLDGIDSKSFSDRGYAGTYKVTIEANFTFSDLATLQIKQNDFVNLAKEFFNPRFENFFNYVEDPTIKMLDNRFIGIYKIYYGLKNED